MSKLSFRLWKYKLFSVTSGTRTWRFLCLWFQEVIRWWEGMKRIVVMWLGPMEVRSWSLQAQMLSGGERECRTPVRHWWIPSCQATQGIMGTAGLIITSSFRLPIKAKVFLSVLAPPRHRAFLMLRLRQFTRMASCVPAACQQNAEWRGEGYLLSPTWRASAAFHTLNRFPEKIRRMATTVMWSPVAHTWSPWSLGASSRTSVQCTGGQRAPVLFYRCHCSWHLEQNVSFEHGSHDPCADLSVHSRSAVLSHKDRMPPAPRRIWAISKEDLFSSAGWFASSFCVCL